MEEIDIHKCDGCGKTGSDVEYVANPYDEDVNDMINMEWLCDACYDEYCQDI